MSWMYRRKATIQLIINRSLKQQFIIKTCADLIINFLLWTFVIFLVLIIHYVEKTKYINCVNALFWNFFFFWLNKFQYKALRKCLSIFSLPREKEAYMDSNILNCIVHRRGSWLVTSDKLAKTLVWIQILTEYSIIYLKRKFKKSKTMATIMNPDRLCPIQPTK